MRICNCSLAGTGICELCTVLYNNYGPIIWGTEPRQSVSTTKIDTPPPKAETQITPLHKEVYSVEDKPVVDEKQSKYLYKVTIEKFDRDGNLVSTKIVEE